MRSGRLARVVMEDAPGRTQPKNERWYFALGLVLVLGLVGGVCGGGWLLVRQFVAGPDQANVDDCLEDDREARPPYRRVSCDDGAARYRVLAVEDWTAFGANPCVDVPGASRLFELPDDDKIVCIGEKDADPMRSANIAREGDCLRMRRDGEAERLDCTDPQANFEVLRRLTDVVVSDLRAPGSPDDGPCSDVPGVATRFAYQWRSEDVTPRAPNLPGKHYDLVFCLARVNVPPPAVPDAPANCRFVTADDVLAAVNAVGGNRHTRGGPGQANGDAPCDYPLFKESGGHDVVNIEMTGSFDWPPADEWEEFTLDGAMAAWHASSFGVGRLAVARPGGNFNVVLSFDGGQPGMREAAVEIYRAAAPHLP